MDRSGTNRETSLFFLTGKFAIEGGETDAKLEGRFLLVTAALLQRAIEISLLLIPQKSFQREQINRGLSSHGAIPGYRRIAMKGIESRLGHLGKGSRGSSSV